MSDLLATQEELLQLLVPANNDDESGESTFLIEGKSWKLRKYARLEDTPPFNCVSYLWGEGQVDHPVEPSQSISDRTLPVLETAICVLDRQRGLDRALTRTFPSEESRRERLAEIQVASQAIWIDAICVPQQQPARAACLRQMGAIYGAAVCVIAVLSPGSAEAIRKVGASESLDLEDLRAINADDWISRAWTYQEQATSRLFFCCSEGHPETLLSHLEFLGAIVDGTTDYLEAQHLPRTELARMFPRLDKMEELLAELQASEFSGRPVFQIISSMAQRDAAHADDHFLAMLSLVEGATKERIPESGLSAAEHFMQKCEAMGDFSFVFCTNERSNLPGQSWRPSSTTGALKPVVTRLLATGNGMGGSLMSTHVELENIVCLEPGRPNPVLRAIENFLDLKIPQEVLSYLRAKDFTGEGAYINLEQGYFFSNGPLPADRKGLAIAVCLDVAFAQGAPALLLRSSNDDCYKFCDVGVFIGRISGSGKAIKIA